MYEENYYRFYCKVINNKDGEPKSLTYSPDNPQSMYTFEEISKFPHAAGILKPGIILVDIDEGDQADRFLRLIKEEGIKTRVTRTTRGIHALFRDNGKVFTKSNSGLKTAVGLVVDVKRGDANGGDIIKQYGQMREILQECECPDMIPKWLMPIANQKYDFYTMGEGDGRNTALYSHIAVLAGKKYNFSEDEAFHCIRLMNKYVMQNPLEESELNIILREGAYPKSKSGGRSGKQFEHWVVGEELIEEYSIKRINGSIHVYQDGIYVPSHNGWLENILIKKDPTLTAAKRAEVVKYIEGKIIYNTPPTDARYIAFQNCLYDIVEGQILDFSPEMILTNRIEYNYAQNAYNELADKTLDKLAVGDKCVRALLEEIIGYCFYRRSELRKSFILIGDKANGKSTYLAMIKTLLGDENTSALDIQELGDRFKTAELVGKLANIGDDIGDEFISNPSVFKKLVSGDRLNAEYKGQKPFDFNNYAKLLFSANNIPRIKDKSGAVLDRLIIVPFDATFSRDDPDFDPYIKYKLITPEVMEYLIVLGIEGLRRVLANQGFSQSDRVEKRIEEYNEENNPILSFFKDLDVEIDLYNQPVEDVFGRYEMFCAKNKFQSLGNMTFSKMVKKHFPEVTIVRPRVNGKQVRIFKKITAESDESV